MTRVRARGEKIRRFILAEVEKHPNDIAKIAAKRFEISRQAINKHLRLLVEAGTLGRSGTTQARKYFLAPLAEWSESYEISPDLAEDVVWTRDVKATVGVLPDNVADIWHYGFTEIFNNAIDHSSGSRILVRIRKTATTTEMLVVDDGLGIFKKIQAAMGLLDTRHSILELSKGKLTTDPSRHTGEGIFFTSRMFDSFNILSSGVFFEHRFGEPEDWILESAANGGTSVWMKLDNHTSRTTTKVFDEFSSGENYGFSKTVVPVKLAQYGEDRLISRSQAKRLLTRVELFKTVILDFSEVDAIGQAFADEIFRVFELQHPEISLVDMHANETVKRMIERARRRPKA